MISVVTKTSSENMIINNYIVTQYHFSGLAWMDFIIFN